ncbi:Uncharacterized protein dnm_039930 [Desulfonema magnum]|uniref:Uncharacterized protein n=1 Tax=Desulfonema magnum TaxID=45655 RepID=A0A975BMX1_9BACT|nr:Uncharacterized protein dnm_039930 [Desulfonema magnum]
MVSLQLSVFIGCARLRLPFSWLPYRMLFCHNILKTDGLLNLGYDLLSFSLPVHQ